MSLIVAAAILVASLTTQIAEPSPGHDHHRHHAQRRGPQLTLQAARADLLYSRAARRRLRTLLRLRISELQLERLERVRKVLERTMSIDQLLDAP